MSDYFDQLKNGSPQHRATTTPDGALVISPLDSSKPSLIAFQPRAKEALKIAAENNRRVKPHTSDRFDDQGEKLYDRIIIFP